jgi:hypothetical protein
MLENFGFLMKLEEFFTSYLFTKSTNPCRTTYKTISKPSRFNPSFSDSSQKTSLSMSDQKRSKLSFFEKSTLFFAHDQFGPDYL